MSSLLHQLAQALLDMIGNIGYFGITFLMAVESSFIPFPSEIVLLPAGVLCAKGELNIFLSLIAGIVGSIAGALFNYFLALKFGREVLIRWGKYLLINKDKIDIADNFFITHGSISIFTARLIPVVRQLISLPAGLARMPLVPFCIFTAVGSGIWSLILLCLGYALAQSNLQTQEQWLFFTTIGMVAVVAGTVVGYIYLKKYKA